MTQTSRRRLFYVGVVLLVAYEIARVYFIMPLPGSQRMRSIDFAYALHTWRWPLRGLFALCIAAGVIPAWRGRAGRKGVVPLALAMARRAAYGSNVTTAAVGIALPPGSVVMRAAAPAL